MNDDRLTRRRLLELGGCGLLATSLPWLPGCGGGASKSGAPPGGTGFDGTGVPGAGTPGAAVTAAQRVAALDAVAAAIAPAPGAAPRFDSAALATRLKAMPAFQRVGISTSRQNVWALFTDGRPLVVPNNLVPAGPAGGLSALAAEPAPMKQARLPSPPVGAAAAPPDLLPALLTQGQYRQLDMFGPVPPGAAVDAAHLCLDFVSSETLPRLRTLAVGRGFTLPPQQIAQPPDLGFDNGVPGLGGLSGDGVFFITATSAAVGAAGAEENVICVDTAASEASEALYAAELGAGRLVYAVSMRGLGGTAWVPYKCLAITPAFAAASWSFPVESLGILNLTGGSVLSDWAAVLSACGLKNVVTWDQAVSWQHLLAFADDLVQLLLATNDLGGTVVRQGIEPRLRAYGVGETLTYLSGKGLLGSAGAQVAFLQAQRGPEIVNTLVPTISYVNIDEGRAVIELNGQFGDRQGAVAEARYAAAPPTSFAEPLLSRAADGPLPGIETLQGPLWNGDLIQSATEPTALMRGGYIQVINGGRSSNAVQITHWEIPLHVVSTITGGLTVDVTVTLHLRADVRGHRMAPDGARGGANRLMIPLSSTVESRADYVASGEIAQTTVDGVTTTITWSGSGAAVNTLLGAIHVTGSGLLYWDTRRLTPFTVAVTGSAPYDQRTVVTRPAPGGAVELVSDTTGPMTVAVTAAVASDGSFLELRFGPDWSLLAGSALLLDEPVTLLGSRVRTTTLSWPAVTPDFPPALTVGGV
jgi:hypothetical protein